MDNNESQIFTPAPERGAHLKKLFRENKLGVLGIAAFIIGFPTAIILEINSVEFGEATHVSVMQPIASIYNNLGYWPAVLFLPVCILLFTGFILFKFIVRW